MKLTYLGHATVLIEMDGTRLLTDPVLRTRIAHLHRHPPPPASVGRLDAVLLSHAHGDHLDGPSLRSLEDHPRVIAPAGVGRLLRRRRIGPVTEISAGEALQIGSLTVRAFQADHDARRLPIGSIRSEALGFLVRGPQSVYFAGDTGLHDDMAILAAEHVDVALVPVAGWGPTLGPGHMDAADAARAVALMKPRIAVPIHWGTLHPLRSAPPTDEPAREFVRHAAELAPGVRCEVLEPGAALEVEG